MPDNLEEGEKAIEMSEWASPSQRGKVVFSEKLTGSQAEAGTSLGKKDEILALPWHV